MLAKQLEMSLLQVLSEMTTQRSRFGQNSCAADQQACVFGSCECKATITWCDLSPRFFCTDATLLCEFERDKI